MTVDDSPPPTSFLTVYVKSTYTALSNGSYDNFVDEC